MKKGVKFFLAVMCVLTLTGCGMSARTEDNVQMTETETLQSAAEEDTVFIDFDDVAVLNNKNDKTEQYCNYLEQVTERNFADEEGIESTDAAVNYEEGAGQYSIELSIKTNGEVGKEQIELYKSVLNKTYAEVTLVVDGEVM